MPVKEARSDLQTRLEQGSAREEVVVLSLTLSGLSREGAAADGALRPVLEAAIRQVVAREVGPGVAPERVSLALSRAEPAGAASTPPRAKTLGRAGFESPKSTDPMMRPFFLARENTSPKADSPLEGTGSDQHAEDSQSTDVELGMAVTVGCTITPPAGMRAGAALAALLASAHRRSGSAASTAAGLAERVARALEAVDGLQASASKTVQGVEAAAPEVRIAVYPPVQLDRRHGIPSRVFCLCDDLQAFADCRAVSAAGSASPAQLDAQELEWSLHKLAEVYKDLALERLFASIVGSLLRQDRRSCHRWAASVPPSTLRVILQDSPVARKIASKSVGVFEQQSQLKSYVADCKLCVALGVAAADALRRWTEDLAPEDRIFLRDAATGLAGLDVPTARGLFDRAACRFIAIDRLVRQGSLDAALRHLRTTPPDVLTSRFAAPWRTGTTKEASFFHLHQYFASRKDGVAAEDFLALLANAFGARPAEADLAAVLRAFLEDQELPGQTRLDLFVAFVSACRMTREAREEASGRRCLCFRRPPAKVEEPECLPSTVGLDVVLLEVLVKELAAREAARLKGHDLGTSSQDLAEMLEVVLLVSTGDSLSEWAQAKWHQDPEAAERLKRFLNSTAGRFFAELMLSFAGGMRATWCDDKKVREYVEGTSLWVYHSSKGTLFSQHARAVGQRRREDFGQLLWMYFKLDLALSAGSIWAFIQILEDGSAPCLATRFNRLAPTGTALRRAVAADVRAACGGVAAVEPGDLEAFVGFYGFFSPSFMGLLRDGQALDSTRDRISKACAHSEEADQAGVVFTRLLEAILRLASLGREPEADDTGARDALVVITEHCYGHYVPQRLFNKVVDAVRRMDRKKDPQFGLTQFCECARELGKAGNMLAHKLERRGTPKSVLAGVERTLDALLSRGLPSSWASSFRSLDTVIFALEYMEKEDLQLAYEQFEAECLDHRYEQLDELLQCVRQIYREPLGAGCRDGMSPDAKIADIIKTSAPQLEKRVIWRGATFEQADWLRVLEIAGAAADAMRQKYNVLMLPHHTQMIALLMFAVRACGGRAGTAGAKRLPKTMLARVGTGEGKSLIIAMLAAFVAKKGMRAHVVNDNRVLAQRDFATNQPLFTALGIQASGNREDLNNEACQIVYCTGDDVEKRCLESLVEGKVQAHEEGLKGAVLIVDEVDGLIFDKGTVSTQTFEDREFSEWVNEWLLQLETKGEVHRDWEDFRSHGECSLALQREVEAAYEESFAKKEGPDYVQRGDQVYLVDSKTGLLQQDAWSLWLEVLRRRRADGKYYVKYKYVKAILCRLQCFMSYSAIFGLTGSLGQSSERQYLREHYEAVTFNVPYFLDTCRAPPEPSPGRPTVGDKVTVRSENSEGNVVELDRVGTRGLVGVITEDLVDQHIYKVRFEGGRTLWYKEKWVAKAQAQGKWPPVQIGDGEPLANREAQERAAVLMATRKCNKVPVLVVVKDSEAVKRVAAQMRQQLWKLYWGGQDATAPAATSAADSLGVIELVHNPRDPQEFVRLVELATEPLLADPGAGAAAAAAPDGAAEAAQVAGGEGTEDAPEGPVALVPQRSGSGLEPRKLWRVTVTTAEGGRGHDYRVADPAIDEKGGLMLILTWVPWSEREWIQFLGRTARQDHPGQFAVLLDGEDEQVRHALQGRAPNESPAEAIMRHGDLESAKVLEGRGEEISKGMLMHKLTSRYWSLHRLEKTSKRQDWEWKRLCQTYNDMTADAIQQTFSTLVVPPKELVLGFARIGNAPLPIRSALAEQTCGNCGTVNMFPAPGLGQPWPTVRCGHCSMLSDEVGSAAPASALASRP